MRILVTGGAGYIGSVLTEELVAYGHNVVVCDDLSTGHRSAVSPAVVFVEGNIGDRDLVVGVLREHSIEAVMHLAAFSRVEESVKAPEKYVENNYRSSVALFEAMIETGVAKVVFSSTAAVYGEPEKAVLTEDDETRPINPYGESKLAVEKALHEYNRKFDFRFVALRYFNVAGASKNYGEWHRPETHLIPRILHAANGKEDIIEIYGNDYPTRDGTCIRDYIHVQDLAAAHILALNALGAGSAIYNLGSGSGYSVNEVVETARRVTGCEIPVQFAGRRVGDPAILTASSEKIVRDLGWRPHKGSLDAIIESAWRWLRDHPNGYVD